jgi:MtfA peptidase
MKQSSGLSRRRLFQGGRGLQESGCLFAWWKRRRRRQLLQTPFPADWEPWLQRYSPLFPGLSPTQQQRVRDDARCLIAEKHWEGCGGFVVTDEHRLAIASQVAVMGLGFPAAPFDRLLSILIYPETFVATPQRRQTWGLEQETGEPLLGEAWYQGPVILAWETIRQQADAPHGRNLVVHEFAHLLDMANAEVDGVPDLDHVAEPQQWADRFSEEFQRFHRRRRWGRLSVLDDYAGTSPIEYFAVSSEAFFAAPVELRTEAPPLYALLQRYYRVDPAAWMTPISTPP